jgi:hypothetical protein
MQMSGKRDIGPDGHRLARDVGPEGHRLARDVEPDAGLARGVAEEADVEGHSMLISPTLGRDLAKARDADIERSVRAKNQEHDAKRVFRR